MFVDENEDLIVALHSLYVDSWEEKSQRAFDYTTNGVLDIVSKVNDYTEEEFVNELAKVVTGFELSYWADNKINDFEEILRDTVNRLYEYNPTEGLQEGEMKITIESSDGNPIISQFSQSELSSTGQMMLNKMKSTLGNFGESVSYTIHGKYTIDENKCQHCKHCIAKFYNGCIMCDVLSSKKGSQ